MADDKKDLRIHGPAAALVHQMPFCSYFGETSAEEIEREIAKQK